MAFSKTKKRWKYVHRVDQDLQPGPRTAELIDSRSKTLKNEYDLIIVSKVNNIMLLYQINFWTIFLNSKRQIIAFSILKIQDNNLISATVCLGEYCQRLNQRQSTKSMQKELFHSTKSSMAILSVAIRSVHYCLFLKPAYPSLVYLQLRISCFLKK